jgi:hypothetical protein
MPLFGGGDANLQITVGADISDADRDLGKLKNKVGDLDGAVAGAGSTQAGFFGGMGGGIAKLGLMATGVGAVASVGGELVGFFVDATKAAGEEQVGIERLNQTLKNSIPGWSDTTGAIDAYISKNEALAFADDELRDSLGFLVGQTGDLAEAQTLQATAMDLARAKGISLEQATKAVGKVDQESLGILKKLGIQVTENMTSEEALTAIRTVSAGQAEVYANSMQGSMDRVGNAFDNAKETIGGAIMTGIQPVLQGLADFVSSPGFSQFISDTMTGIGAVFETVGSVIGTVWGFIETTILPIAQAVFAELQKWWVEMQPALTEAWNAIQTAVTDAWNFIQPLLDAGLAFIKQLWEEVWPGIQTTFEGVWTAVQGVLQTGWAIIEGIWNTVTSILQGDWEGAWNAIKTMFEGIWKGVETFMDGVWTTIKGLWDTGTAYIKTVWETAWTGIRDFFTGVWTFITDDLPKKLGEIWDGITTWVTDSASQLGTKIMEFATNFWNWITEVVNNIGGKLGEIWTKITTWVSDTARDIWDKVLEIGDQIVGGIKQGIINAWEAFTGWLTGMFDGAVKGIKDFLGISSPSRLLADEVGSPMVEGVKSGWSGGFPNLRATMIGDIDLLVGDVRARAEQIAAMMQNLQMSGSSHALALGGPARAGQPYLVGERGPELFVPGASGTVVPNSAFRPSGGAMQQPVYVILNFEGQRVTPTELTRQTGLRVQMVTPRAQLAGA